MKTWLLFQPLGHLMIINRIYAINSFTVNEILFPKLKVSSDDRRRLETNSTRI
jgi:hypothetical protein